jgi:hypothetical protein
MKQIKEANILEYLITNDVNEFNEPIIANRQKNGSYAIEGASGISGLTKRGKWINYYNYWFKGKQPPEILAYKSIEKAYNKFAQTPFEKIEISNIWMYLANEETKAAARQMKDDKWIVEDVGGNWFLGIDGHTQDCIGILTASDVPIMEFNSFEDACEAAEKIAAEDIEKLQFNKKM